MIDGIEGDIGEQGPEGPKGFKGEYNISSYHQIQIWFVVDDISKRCILFPISNSCYISRLKAD